MTGSNSKSESIIEKKYGFVSLCYHYIRENKNDRFPRILGATKNEFEEHLKMIMKDFSVINLENIKKIEEGQNNLKLENPGMLITFDDGLSDHYDAAKILAKNNIQGVFFIPTCIFEEKLPANPMIIHYTIAEFGIKKFVDEFSSILERKNIKKDEILKNLNQRNDVWEKIRAIKEIFKYKLNILLSREILIEIYKNMFLKKYSDALSIIHLTEKQVKEMLDMGHSIGTHTHTHISVKASNLSENKFFEEVINPKAILEEKFQTNVEAFSYPFGNIKDCLVTKQLIDKTNVYKIAFTVEEIFNSQKFDMLQIGRYQPKSKENSSVLREKLECMIRDDKT